MKRTRIIIWSVIVFIAIMTVGFFGNNLDQSEYEENVESYNTSPEVLVFPTSTETPNPQPTPQQVGKITIYYKLTDVIREEMFGGTYVDHETLTFTRNSDGKWSTVEGSPKFQDFGPLYRLYDYELFATTNGDCGINSYNDVDGYKTPRHFTPQCQDIPSETMASVTFGLENCDIDVQKSIICSKETPSGKLYYKLYKNLDIFEFNYTGFWSEGEYPAWINQATQALGFPPVANGFYENMQSGKNYTINKENKGG